MAANAARFKSACWNNQPEGSRRLAGGLNYFSTSRVEGANLDPIESLRYE